MGSRRDVLRVMLSIPFDIAKKDSGMCVSGCMDENLGGGGWMCVCVCVSRITEKGFQ